MVQRDVMCPVCYGNGHIRKTPTDAETCMTCQGVGRVWDDKPEAVNHPSHYGGADNPYEVIKVLENWLTREEFIGALKFNIIKYTARARQKDGQEAHEKSAWYDAYLVDFLKRNPK